MFAAMRATGKMKGKESAVHMAMIGKMAKGWKTKARAAKERRDGETRERGGRPGGGERGGGGEGDGDYFGRRVYSLFALFRFVSLCFALFRFVGVVFFLVHLSILSFAVPSHLESGKLLFVGF